MKNHDHSNELPATLQRQVSDKRWRMEHLYWIINKSGHRVLLTFNDAQELLWRHRWYANVVAKARQLGTTTMIALNLLDECLWNPNTEVGIVAHKKPAASDIFRRKILYAYDNLPADIRQHVHPTIRSHTQLVFSNNSSITVDTTLRSATTRMVLISELGTIAAYQPERAREILTGATETVGPNGVIWLESTVGSQAGVFNEVAQRAWLSLQSRATLTRMDYAFHFLAWWLNAEYTLPEHVDLPAKMTKYFRDLKGNNRIPLTAGQKGWYWKKREILGDDIFFEHPSTPEEAFAARMRGTFFANEFSFLRNHKRFKTFEVDPEIAVDTAWDLGMDQYTSIWFFQRAGNELHFIDFYENSEHGLRHYAEVLEDKAYRYGSHFGPHDIRVRELGSGKTRLEQAGDLGIRFKVVRRPDHKADAIETARALLRRSWFNPETCAEGIEHLENYHRRWDDRLGVWSGDPLEDEHCHGADAYQTAALGIQAPQLQGTLMSMIDKRAR